MFPISLWRHFNGQWMTIFIEMTSSDLFWPSTKVLAKVESLLLKFQVSYKEKKVFLCLVTETSSQELSPCEGKIKNIYLQLTFPPDTIETPSVEWLITTLKIYAYMQMKLKKTFSIILVYWFTCKKNIEKNIFGNNFCELAFFSFSLNL